VRKDGQQAPGPEVQLVWEAPGDAAEASQGTAGRPRVARRRTLLIGAGALMMVAGAAYGAEALSTQPRHAAAGATTRPSSLVPAGRGSTLPTGPSSRPTSSQSATAAPSAVAVPSTVAAPNAGSVAAPVGTRAPAAAAVPAEPPAPPPVGDWLLNQTVGNDAVDSTGAHDGTAQDGWWAAGAGCLFNGTNSQIYTNGPVLSTGPGASFTVSAWVDMTASGENDETVVSQDAVEDSGFYLQYTEQTNRWAFSRASTDTENPAVSRALSASPPTLDAWTHLVGVYDAADDTLHLYVNGVAQGTATDSTPFASGGDLAFGRARFDGQDTDWLKGAIKKVEVFDAALGPTRVSALS
jgi:Concanavalin A-like lectin/glucanases superfamily